VVCGAGSSIVGVMVLMGGGDVVMVVVVLFVRGVSSSG
jgi:hypothetical protein